MKKIIVLLAAVMLAACSNKTNQEMGDQDNIRLMVLDPGHFHASLVFKTMYEGVDPTVQIYAPEGMEVQDYVDRVASYNSRVDDPTSWELKVYTGDDYLEKMLEEGTGNMVVLAGNNRKKTEYIHAAIEKGLHVYSDKPMAINGEDFNLLLDAFRLADEKGLLLYDIMTERYEITTILQRMFSMQEGIFGTLLPGSPEEPSITKESVHHFFKYVSGKPLQRPVWFFDITQQGEAIADVGTHLVDLILWEAFREVVKDYSGETEIITSERWPTPLSPEEFELVTGAGEFPEFLSDIVENDTLYVPANSSLVFKVRDIYAKASVEWAFRAPEGAGDTHYSIMRGSKAKLVIRQGAEEGYVPQLYIEANNTDDAEALQKAIDLYLENSLWADNPGVEVVATGKGAWKVNIPEEYRIGHEAHFAQVTKKFLEYYSEGAIPEWEKEQMITKYYITTSAVKK